MAIKIINYLKYLLMIGLFINLRFYNLIMVFIRGSDPDLPILFIIVEVYYQIYSFSRLQAKAVKFIY